MSEKNQLNSAGKASSGALTDDLVRIGAEASRRSLPAAIVMFVVFVGFGAFLLFVGLNQMQNPSVGDHPNIAKITAAFGLFFFALGGIGVWFNSGLHRRLGNILKKHQ